MTTTTHIGCGYIILDLLVMLHAYRASATWYEGIGWAVIYSFILAIAFRVVLRVLVQYGFVFIDKATWQKLRNR